MTAHPEEPDPCDYLNELEQQADVHREALNRVTTLRLETLAAVEAGIERGRERFSEILNSSQFPPEQRALEAIALAVDVIGRLVDPKAALAALRGEIINGAT